MNMSLRTQGVTKRFGKSAGVEDITMELPAGCVGVVLGPNGAGKSTFLRLVLGLLRPDAGELRVLGLDPVQDADRVHAAIGYMPDVPDCPGWLTAAELFAFLAPLYGDWDRDCVERLVERFQVPLDTPIQSLSRGQAAKTQLIAALAPSPRLLLLDEPFSGLDPLARRDLLQVFLEELDRLEAAALVATHDLEVAARIAERVFVLDQGRLVTAGPVNQVLGRPEEEPTRVPAQLLGLLETLRSEREEVAA